MYGRKEEAFRKWIMRELALPQILSSEKITTTVDVLNKARKRWLLGSLIAGICGACSGLLGLALCGMFAFELLTETLTLGRLETGLMVGAFPLFILAAHCLDKSDEIKKAAREEFCKQQRSTKETC